MSRYYVSCSLKPDISFNCPCWLQLTFTDILISLTVTCLSFYHGGLTQAQTREAIEQVLKSDDPASLYERWVDETLPEYLRDWQSLNVDDPQQLAQIWSCVRYRVAVIDYYLNRFVFFLFSVPLSLMVLIFWLS